MKQHLLKAARIAARAKDAAAFARAAAECDQAARSLPLTDAYFYPVAKGAADACATFGALPTAETSRIPRRGLARLLRSLAEVAA